ncbi:MAG TPA: hypothetical protein VFY84_14875 [Jiangellales bacterium]|nr:hypothetical protein [Jiangellales bacterium]
MHADLETLAIALYVKVDDDLKTRPELVTTRRPGGITPKLTDAELVTMAVMQALLNIRSNAAGCATWASTCGTCSRTSPSSPATTSGCAPLSR